MVSKELNDWLQVIGLFGVVAGLVFVGLQLRLESQIASSDATGANSEQLMALAQLVTDNAEVWVAGRRGDPLSDTDAAKFEVMAEAYIAQVFSRWVRASDMLTGAVPTVFTKDLAIDLHNNPGLLKVWLELKTVRDGIRESEGRQGSTPWHEAVSEELARLQATGR